MAQIIKFSIDTIGYYAALAYQHGSIGTQGAQYLVTQLLADVYTVSYLLQLGVI